jgi:hypothetical protein
VHSPERPIDSPRMWAATLANTARWRQHAALQDGLMQCRLNSMAVFVRGVRPDDMARLALLQQVGAKAGVAEQLLRF